MEQIKNYDIKDGYIVNYQLNIVSGLLALQSDGGFEGSGSR